MAHRVGARARGPPRVLRGGPTVPGARGHGRTLRAPGSAASMGGHMRRSAGRSVWDVSVPLPLRRPAREHRDSRRCGRGCLRAPSGDSPRRLPGAAPPSDSWIAVRPGPRNADASPISACVVHSSKRRRRISRLRATSNGRRPRDRPLLGPGRARRPPAQLRGVGKRVMQAGTRLGAASTRHVPARGATGRLVERVARRYLKMPGLRRCWARAARSKSPSIRREAVPGR